jgi:probable rRNA maturation factor
MSDSQLELIFKVHDKRISLIRIERLVSGLVKHFALNRNFRKALPQSSEFKLLSIIFVSSRESKALNFKYRKKNYPTDVLSFNETESKRGLGELVLCPVILGRQAKELKHSFKTEIDYMLIHGFLHLLGFEHEKSRREELKMLRLQDKLFFKLSK